MATAQAVMEKIEALAPERIAEVEEFVDFISAKTRRRAALDRLLDLVPALEAAGAESPTEDDIMAEVAAARTA
jgi:hypothetical protein